MAATEQENQKLKAAVEGNLVDVAQRLGLHAGFMSPTEAQALQQYEQAKTWRDFCRAHPQGWKDGQGVEHDANEVQELLARSQDVMLDVGATYHTTRSAVQSRIREALEEGMRVLNACKAPCRAAPAQPPALPGTPPTAAPRAPVSRSRQTQGTGRLTQEDLNRAGGGREGLASAYATIMSGPPS